MTAVIVYVLCAITSLGCACLLLKGWRTSRASLLLWSAICFFGFTLNNIVLIIDLVLLPTTINLGFIRNMLGLSAVASLVYGLIWEVE